MIHYKFKYLLLFTFVFLLSISVQAQDKPNFLIIMADDLGHGDISLNGGITPTQNIDNLIQSGTRLHNFLVAPVCSPTRAGLLTAINPLKTGNGPRTEGFLDQNIMNFGRFFQTAGYKTGMFGKTHNGRPPNNGAPNEYPHINDYGFDRFVGFYAGGQDYITKARVGWYEDRNLVVNEDPNVDTPGEEDHFKYATDLITDKAIDFINQSVDVDNKPFVCYVPYSAVHTPYNITQEYLDAVPQVLKDAVSSGLRPVENYNYLAIDVNTRIWNFEKFEDDIWSTSLPGLTTQERDVLYSAVTIGLDVNVGRLIEHLETKEITNNTVVLFISDNGANVNGSNLPHDEGKHTIKEGGINIPAGIKIPSSVLANTQSDVHDICTYLDVFPTMVDLANLTGLPNNIDGKSLVDKIQGTSTTADNDYYYFCSYRDDDTVRGNRYKLIRRVNSFYLYDIISDPSESINLVDNPAYASVFADLKDKIEQLAIDNLMANGHVPLINPGGNTLDFTPYPEDKVISIPISATTNADLARQVKDLFASGAPGRSDAYLEYDIKIEIAEEDKDKLEYCYISHSKGATYFDDNNGVDDHGNLLQSHNSLVHYTNTWERVHAGIGNIAPNRFSDYDLVYKFSSPANATVYLDNVTVKNFRTSNFINLFLENTNGNNRLVSSEALPVGLTYVDADLVFTPSETLNIVDGLEVTIKAKGLDAFLSRESGTIATFSNNNSATNTEGFVMEEVTFDGDTFFAIKGTNSYYLSNENGNRTARFTRNTITARERFTLVSLGNNEYAIMDRYGKYGSYANRTNDMIFDADAITSTETFVFENFDGTLSTKELIKEKTVFVSGNPVTDVVRISNLKDGTTYQVEVYNYVGQKIMIDAFVDKSKNTIAVSNLAIGNYVLVLKSASLSNKVLKFTKI